MKWDALRVFLAVARTGQMLGAAGKLGLDQATVSRHVRGLEESLGAQLFQRSPTGATLTAEGERLLPFAERMESEALQIAASVGHTDVGLSGVVRIGAPDGFGTYVLAPMLAQLAARHPELRLQLVPLPRNFSLSKREADIAITLERPSEGRLVAQKLTDYTISLYGSEAYLDAIGGVERPEDLGRCLFVTYFQDMLFSPRLDYGRMVLDRAAQVFECASVVAQMQALRRGGVGYVHDYAATAAPDLRRILPELAITMTYWIVIHADSRGISRMAAVSEAIRSEVNDGSRSFALSGM